ncbi:MAG: hypothetical protein BWX92_02375 [Deltaproteobacteria bacterium ADurb.Bin135]|nr:MAG: hypothetical protein BWX92_02375 [Deltaproteobacteria bacterium ADurb.Bin135]
MGKIGDTKEGGRRNFTKEGVSISPLCKEGFRGDLMGEKKVSFPHRGEGAGKNYFLELIHYQWGKR